MCQGRSAPPPDSVDPERADRRGPSLARALAARALDDRDVDALERVGHVLPGEVTDRPAMGGGPERMEQSGSVVEMRDAVGHCPGVARGHEVAGLAVEDAELDAADG